MRVTFRIQMRSYDKLMQFKPTFQTYMGKKVHSLWTISNKAVTVYPDKARNN